MKKKGISLIVLVITIIVLAILATVTIVTMNAEGLIPFTSNAAFKSRISTYIEELSAYHSDRIIMQKDYDPVELNSNVNLADISNAIPSIKEEDKPFLFIKNGELRIRVSAGETKVKLASEQGVLTDMYEVAIDEFPDESMFSYTVSGGKATITGFASKVSTYDDDDTKDVIIPYKIDGYEVIKIGAEAFYDMWNIERIVIPHTVTQISNYAFAYCSGLKDVVLSDNLMSIGTHVFYSCGKIGSITFPKTLSDIGRAAFKYCNNLVMINYRGRADEWKAISIATGNEKLTNAAINYNYVD